VGTELSGEQGLSSWTGLGYAKSFDLNPDAIRDNVPRIHVQDVSEAEFVERYERVYKPVVITGVTNEWKASYKWTVSRLGKKYRNQKFKCGEDNSGYSVKLKMKYFIHYMHHNEDDSPLYVFDSSFAEVSAAIRLMPDPETHIPHLISITAKRSCWTITLCRNISGTICFNMPVSGADRLTAGSLWDRPGLCLHPDRGLS
jgi:hypothetical protein